MVAYLRYPLESSEGNEGTLWRPAALVLLVDDEVSHILLSDDFAGNDDVGSTRTLIPDQNYTVGDPSTYTLRISGIIKGNAFAVDQGFMVDKVLVIVGGR